MSQRLSILTWHVHGNYLYSLTQLPHDFIIPTMADNRPGYSTLGNKIPWGKNVRMVAAESLREQKLDVIIYQSRSGFEYDRFHLLTPQQRALPSVYIEHNPPEPHPTDTIHFFRHGRGVLVHVTHYNELMWNSAGMPTAVIEHGVPEPSEAIYSGELSRGIAVINHLRSRGRRVGADIYEWMHARTPLDLIGMGSEGVPGGRGEIANMDVPAFVAQYRYFFSPVRYASLGLSVVEAMMVGAPVVGIAATELSDVIQNGVNGYVDTRPSLVLEAAQHLLNDEATARRWGMAAQETARQRFNMDRYVADWERLLQELMGAERDAALLGESDDDAG